MVRRSASLYEELGDATLAAYVRCIARIGLLGKAEELALGARVRAGDERAFRRLVEANLRFVVKVALRYQGCGLSLLDLIHEGNLGLLEAARRYSPEHQVKLITYAVWWIRQAMLRALAAGGGAVRLPVRKARLASWVQELRGERAPDRAEEWLDLELSRTGAIPAADQEYIAHAFHEEVARMLRHLQPRERAVIEMRFGLGAEEVRTLEEVGRRLHLSRERIRQIEEQAKQKLRLLARVRQLHDYLT